MENIQLLSPSTDSEWAAYHRIRESVLRIARGMVGVYDSSHPDGADKVGKPSRLTSSLWEMIQAMTMSLNRAFSMAVLVIIAFAFSGCARIPETYEPKSGDLVFQSLPLNPLVFAIEGVTDSPFSHCGIVVEGETGWNVLESIGPVKETPLLEWIDQGRENQFWVYRLDSSFDEFIPDIIRAARKNKGKNYDSNYSFENEDIYCSELIYNAILEVTGRPVGKVQKLGDLNWKPYEENIININGFVPLDREMITPLAMTKAPEVILIYPHE